MASERHTCPHCSRAYVATAKHPTSCGRVGCRARATYTADDWAGAARCARARQAAGVALNDLDHEAIRRDTR